MTHGSWTPKKTWVPNINLRNLLGPGVRWDSVPFKDWWISVPIASMYGRFYCIYHTNQPNVGKYTIHGCYGYWNPSILCCVYPRLTLATPQLQSLRLPSAGASWSSFGPSICGLVREMGPLISGKSRLVKYYNLAKKGTSKQIILRWLVDSWTLEKREFLTFLTLYGLMNLR